MFTDALTDRPRQGQQRDVRSWFLLLAEAFRRSGVSIRKKGNQILLRHRCYIHPSVRVVLPILNRLYGSGSRVRTCDLGINSPALCQLSYPGKGRGQDSRGANGVVRFGPSIRRSSAGARMCRYARLIVPRRLTLVGFGGGSSVVRARDS